ncbi:MAG: hypothetical protein AAF390_14020 [Pseudomonadota bacterium]
MLIVTHDTVRNPDILEVRQLPRKFIERVTVWPKRRLGWGEFLRIVAEFRPVRYGMWLLPLAVIALIWQGTALPLSQAPVPMVILIWWIEVRVLRVPEGKRGDLIDPDAAARGLDLLKVQGRAVLTRIAAGRALRAGELRLVVEQSPLAKLAPLTYVSVQAEAGPEVVALTEAERAIIEEGLFQPPLDERLLHRINSAEDEFLREVTLDARSVSAHARMEAALA